jgi:DNA polymerase I-like protein with 3'-5' exonuclease and polymerase domains
VRPRVILALGGVALAALTGYEHHYEKQVPKPTCEHCGGLDSPERKVDGVMCSNKACKHVWQAGGVHGERPEVCPAGCGKVWGKLKQRMVPCPVCGGRKTQMEPRVDFRHDYKITEIAGAVIPAEKHGWEDSGVKYIVPTYHPSFLLRPPKAGQAMGGQFAAKPVQKHIAKANFLLTHDVDWRVEFEVTHATDLYDAADHVREYFEGQSGNKFSCDIETKAIGVNEAGEEIELDARKVNHVSHIMLVGFYPVDSNDRDYALVVDTRNLNPKVGGALYAALRGVLGTADISKVFHHGNYDAPVIEKLWKYPVEGYTDDTLILHHTLYPDEAHTLAHVAFSYTFARAWKPPKMLHGREAHESWAEECLYNARDCRITAETFGHMRRTVNHKGLGYVYELSMKLQQQALSMWRNGMPLNMGSVERVGLEAFEREVSARQEMRELLQWEDFNPNSTDQLAEALYVRLHNPVVMQTEGGKPSTSKDAVLRLEDTPFKRALLAQRDAATTLRNYFRITGDPKQPVVPDRNLYVWPDSRIRFLWKCFGARTGRWSSNPNAQNWPKWLRSLVEAPEGWVVVGADYDQLELRIMAGLTGDAELIRRCLTADGSRKLEPDYDPHSYVASVALGKAFTELSLKDPKHDKSNERCKCETCSRKALRDLCKRVIYALNYGSGDNTILEAIYGGGYNGPPITLNMIGQVRRGIFRAFPGVGEYQDDIVKRATRERAVYSPLLGRRRIFPLGDVPVTEVLNFPIQSAAADIINIRSTDLYEYALQHFPTAQYMAQVHDAVYYLVREDEADDFGKVVTEKLSWTTALYDGGPEVPYSAAAEKAQDWKNAG